MDFFPRPILDLFDGVQEMDRFEADLVQGRWNQNLMPRVMNYEIEPEGLHRKIRGV